MMYSRNLQYGTPEAMSFIPKILGVLTSEKYELHHHQTCGIHLN